jgi:hypothetical protein
MNFLADKKLKTRKNRYDRSLILLLLLPSLSPSFHFSLCPPFGCTLFLLSALDWHLRDRHDTCFYAFFQAAESQRLAKRYDSAA